MRRHDRRVQYVEDRRVQYVEERRFQRRVRSLQPQGFSPCGRPYTPHPSSSLSGYNLSFRVRQSEEPAVR